MPSSNSTSIASRSMTTARPAKPSARSTASATAMSLTAQSPPPLPGKAWWKPPCRFRVAPPLASASRAASMVPPVASRTMFIASSTFTSLG